MVWEGAMKVLLVRFARDARGTTAIEYGLIGGLMFLSLVVGASAFGTEMRNLFARIETAVTTTTP
jgi:pilus assembly protein Flp/PilA